MAVMNCQGKPLGIEFCSHAIFFLLSSLKYMKARLICENEQNGTVHHLIMHVVCGVWDAEKLLKL